MTLLCGLMAAYLTVNQRDPSGWALAAAFAALFDLSAVAVIAKAFGV